MRFGAALCALAILRYITDHAPQLSLSVLTRIVSREVLPAQCPSGQPECQPSRAACAWLCATGLYSTCCLLVGAHCMYLWWVWEGTACLESTLEFQSAPCPSPQVSSNDTAMALLPLLDQPPWVRRSKAGAIEKFVGGSWRAVEPRERHRLTQHDGQVLLLCLLLPIWVPVRCIVSARQQQAGSLGNSASAVCCMQGMPGKVAVWCTAAK